MSVDFMLSLKLSANGSRGGVTIFSRCLEFSSLRLDRDESLYGHLGFPSHSGHNEIGHY